MPAGDTEARGRADHRRRRPGHGRVPRRGRARRGLLRGGFKFISHTIFVKSVRFGERL